MFLNAWKLLIIMLKYPYLCLTVGLLSSPPKCYFFAGRHIFIRKMKIKMADCKKHVLSKVEKNIIFQNKTLLVMFYRHNKTFWYQFCNSKHFLKAENREDSLATSCEEFPEGFPVNQYETIGTRCRYSASHDTASLPGIIYWPTLHGVNGQESDRRANWTAVFTNRPKISS